MKPTTELDTRLNDALADMMTRNYVQIVEGCRRQGSVSSGADVKSSFCSMHERAEAENWNSLRVAMGTTAYYLSTHIAVALSALAHVDDLWVGTGLDTLDARISRVREYGPLYRSFNEFLGENLVTVANAIETAGLAPPSLGSLVFGFAGGLAEFFRTPKLIIGNRRDVAFDTGLRMAKLIPVGAHPWTLKGADGRMHMRAKILEASAFPPSAALETELRGIAAEGDQFAAALGNPLMQLFGGHNFRSLEDPNDRATCTARMTDY